jgi:hypothetical protein
MTADEPTYEWVRKDELARLHRVEEAARDLLEQSTGRRSATAMLTAMAALRAAIEEAAS